MSDNPSAPLAQPKHLLIASFTDEERAGQVLAEIQQARSTAGLGVEETAIVRREDDGKLSIKEQNDVNMGVSAAAGGLLGGLLGGLFGRGATGAVLGGLLGAGAAKVIDAGVNDQRLQEIGAGLAAGSSAIAAIVNDSALPAARALVESKGGVVTVEPISGGATINIPKTGIAQVDSLVEQASAAAQPYVGTAAAGLSSAAASTEEAARQAGDQISSTFKGLTGGEAKSPAA